jgi:O-antigen/teichoic acid export membrane protein
VKTVSIIMGIGAIVNVFLNLLLIPKLSYIGAGIATIITQGTCLMLAFYFMSKYLYRLPMRKTIIKPIIASLGMGFFVFYFQNVNLLILVFTAAIVYLVIFAGINGFDKEDWQLLKRLIKRGE